MTDEKIQFLVDETRAAAYAEAQRNGISQGKSERIARIVEMRLNDLLRGAKA